MNGRVVDYVMFFLYAGFCLTTAHIYASSYSNTNNGIVLTLTAIKNVVEYFKKNYQGMTLDTVFGLRVIEGQCKLIVEEYEKHQLDFSSRDIIKHIGELGTEAGKVANMAIPHLVEHDREYFGLLKQLIVGPWKVFRSHRIVNPSLRWLIPLNPPVFSEIESNYCLNELMGEVKQNQNACNLTEDCLRKMFAPGQLDHYLQRQIFYTIVASKMKCESQITDYLVARTHYKNLDQVQHEYCTNAYYELEESVASHGLSEDFKDLFLETEFLCPSLGYFQFIKPPWLDAIVSWQSNDGCFSKVKEKEFPQNFLEQDQIKGYHAADLLTVHPLSHVSQEHVEDPMKRKPQHPSNDQYIPRIVPHYDVEQREFHYQNIHDHMEDHPVHNVKRIDDINNNNNPYVNQHNRGLKSVNLMMLKHMSSPKQHWKEQVLSGGCLAHMTAMASASLALYLRYLVDPGPPEFRHLQLENSFYQYTNPQSNVAHHPAVPVNGMPGNDGHLRDKTRKQDQNVDAHYESHHAVEDQNPYKNYHESSFHNPPGLDTSLSLHQKNGPPNLKDMMSRTWNFMGSYQRKYGPQFQPIYAGTNLHEDENGKPAADMVHKADVKKELPDWTISFLNSKMKSSNKMPTLLETNLKNSGVTKSTLSRTKNVSDHGVGGDVGQFVAAPWRRYKDVLHNTKTAHPSHNVNLTHPVKKDSHVDESKNGQLQVHIIEIHSPLQNDLDHYLVAVVLISLVCLLVLFQYFRQRRKYVKSKTRVF